MENTIELNDVGYDRDREMAADVELKHWNTLKGEDRDEYLRLSEDLEDAQKDRDMASYEVSTAQNWLDSRESKLQVEKSLLASFKRTHNIQ